MPKISKASKQAKPAMAAAPAASAAPIKKTANLFSLRPYLPDDFVQSIQRLEAALNKHILLFVHLTGPQGYNFIHHGIWRNFVAKKVDVRKKDMALLIDSPGGDAEAAYRISRLLQRECGKFTAIVPRCAKSAATLMALGADDIIMGDDADLGPLDAQYRDFDTEESMVSALDTVQAVEQLEENAGQLAVNMLENLREATQKKYNTLIRQSLHFAADVTRPLFQSVDAIKYSRQARVLKEAQYYAERLLRARFSKDEAELLAKALVRDYPCHGFVIDRDEASKLVPTEQEGGTKQFLGLQVSAPPTAEARKEIDWLVNNMNNLVAFGYLADVTAGGKKP
jgi:ClpP class serine protease